MDHINTLSTLCILYSLILTVNGYTTTTVKANITSTSWAVYCRYQANTYACSTSKLLRQKWYYDTTLQRCDTFSYGNCKDSFNVFDDRAECVTKCDGEIYNELPKDLTPNTYCRLQPEFGRCDSYHPMFYFDISELRCKGFSWSGCGGNKNRFSTSVACKATCSDIVKYPEDVRVY